MKLKTELLIEADRDTVWRAFERMDQRQKWQPRLKAYRQVTGTPGEVGAVAELTYDDHGRDVVVTETIAERRQPDFLAATYDTAKAVTLRVNAFEASGDTKTRWTLWSNTRFKGSMKFLAIFTATRMRQNIEDDMQRFKLLVETEQAAGAS